MMQEKDGHWMQRALVLAERGRGYVEPNPLVGAVIVQGEQLVGEGWHERFGQAHAEVNALAAAGEHARGGTLYVTLEPCCHHGKTPPCTEAILRAGIRRVVAAMADPFVQVAGRGLAVLRTAGLTVEVGVGTAAAQRLNAPYLKLITTGRPYVHAKWAMSLDGKIATRTGDSKWISGPASRHWVYALRGRMDAIVVGGGTARADDPLLTARPPGPRTALRIVLSRSGNVRLDSQLIRTARTAPLLIAMAGPADSAQARTLRDHGCEVFCVSGGDYSEQLRSLLDELGRRRLTNMLVEGGSTTLGSFCDAAALDEVHVFLAPKLIGGARGLTPVSGLGIERINQAIELNLRGVEQIENDVVVHAVVRNFLNGT